MKLLMRSILTVLFDVTITISVIAAWGFGLYTIAYVAHHFITKYW